MAVLTTKARKGLRSSTFALPGRRFPINDKTHARVAKSYASRMHSRGQLSSSEKSKVDAKADKMLMADGGPVTPPPKSTPAPIYKEGPGDLMRMVNDNTRPNMLGLRKEEPQPPPLPKPAKMADGGAVIGKTKKWKGLRGC